MEPLQPSQKAFNWSFVTKVQPSVHACSKKKKAAASDCNEKLRISYCPLLLLQICRNIYITHVCYIKLICIWNLHTPLQIQYSANVCLPSLNFSFFLHFIHSKCVILLFTVLKNREESEKYTIEMRSGGQE